MPWLVYIIIIVVKQKWTVNAREAESVDISTDEPINENGAMVRTKVKWDKSNWEWVSV